MTKQEAIDILNNKGFEFCDYDRCDNFCNALNCEECDEALTMAMKALYREKWISVAEQRPEEDTRALVMGTYFSSSEINIDMWNGKSWVKHGSHVIAWMPLPEPPTEDEKSNLITLHKSNLFEIYKELEKVNTAQKELQENYENELRTLKAQKKELETKLQYETDGIDSNRIDNAKRFIYIEGLKHNYGHGETRTCVDDLISDIVNDNYKILKEYYGCKDYDRFICQRSDHKYGFGPKHGDIVFSIRATQDFREGKIVPNEKDKNDILYMLENVKNNKIKE